MGLKNLLFDLQSIKSAYLEGMSPSTLLGEVHRRIKLADESLPYKDKKYEYWTKTTKEGNYFKKLRKKIGDKKIECYFDGDLEA